MGDASEKEGWQPDAQPANFKPRNDLSFPALDVISYAFGRLGELDAKHAIYVDANEPANHVLAGTVQSQVKKISTGLRMQGLKAGDCVCIHSFNSIWYPLFWLAIIAAGGIVTGSNPAYTSIELTHHLKTTKAKFVVAQGECLAAVKEAVSECDISMSNVFVLGTNDLVDPGNFVSLDPTTTPIHEQDICNERIAFDDEEAQEATIAVHAATSGTTGLPKAAEISHKYLVTQTSILEHVFSSRREEMRQLVCLPVFHAFAAQLAILLPLRLGITTFFMPRFDLATYISYVLYYQITDSAIVPPIVSALLTAPPSHLGSLQYVICAGAPMKPTVQAKLASRLDWSATIAQCWGTTETGWLTLFDYSERDNSGSVGRLLPNVTLKLVNENGDTVTSDNVHGEARIKSPSIIRRYLGNPAASAGLFDEDGFYRTGDRVFVRNGKVFIDGRIKDIMKVNGWQVSPQEIENVLLELDDVVDCAVVGHVVTSQSGLEETKPRAFIVRRFDSIMCAKNIHAHVKKRLVGYKRLSGGIVFIDKLPRSNVGKVLRRTLFEMQATTDAQASTTTA